MKYELKCKHYWERFCTCENRDLTKFPKDAVKGPLCPYFGESEMELLGYEKRIKCSGFTPQDNYCPKCGSVYRDGITHECKDLN